MGRNRAGTQAIQVPTDTRFGQRKQLEAAQDAIPLPDNQTQAPAPTQAGAAQPMPQSLVDVFGSSQRPSEPLTAGASMGPGPDRLGELPDDPIMLVRAIHMQFPSPGTARFLERAAQQADQQ